MGIRDQALAAGLTLASCLGPGVAAADSCAADRVTVLGPFGRARFTVSIADDPQERAQGLMNVAEMPLMDGMLFLYDTPQHATFWMHNTLIPLDMLFADETGTILVVHADAVPMDDTVIDGGEGVHAVLEINGGLAERLGIKPGDRLQHPAFGDDAAAPCGG